ncbi:MAG: HNH endonuclease signature motif containing protein [Microbacteriaceae bacterium]
MVITKEELNKRDAEGNLTGIGFMEDTGAAVAPAMLEHLLCDTGTVEITVDGDRTPLDVGREQRRFTAKQGVALAIRDGGCMHQDCDRPPSYTEAHHIDEWVADHGQTNIKLGILLCRFHHMLLHNQHCKIRRKGSAYWLYPPNGDPRAPVQLHSQAAWWRGKQAG